MNEQHLPTDSILPAANPRPTICGIEATIKRLIDVVGAALGILLSAPLMILIAPGIKLDSPGPVFFVQIRAGLLGRPFKVYKFRTMAANAEDLLEELIDIDALDEPVFKLRDDPRVTRVGRFLRRWSLDELPQLLNVLKGDMSLVGPRPEEVRIVQYYNGFHRMRLLAKPGMTGPVQINGRGDLLLRARVQLEIDYIQNYSVGNDLRILLETIPAVIKGRGSY